VIFKFNNVSCPAVQVPSRLHRTGIALLGASLFAAACDAARTDASYWDRAPGLQSGDAGTGAPRGGGTPSPGGDASGPVPEPASAACARVEVTTSTYRGEFAPENVGAIWITTSTGLFVRSLDVWGSKRLKHAVAWLAASLGNDVDAVTGATRQAAGAHLVTWDCRSAEGTRVAPGTYVVHVEFTEENSATESPPGPHRELSFVLASSVNAASLPDDTRTIGFRVVPLP
jgi:hypothetical protein